MENKANLPASAPLRPGEPGPVEAVLEAKGSAERGPCGTEKEFTGQELAGQELAGQELAGQELAGQVLAGQEEAEQGEAYVLACTVNGKPVEIRVPASRRLLQVLRDDLGLTGTKRSCELGRCGACMVLIGGVPINACLTMAYQCEGSSIVTIEGLSESAPEGTGSLHPVQEAFLEEGGFQCGYCTPGMVLSTVALLENNPRPTQEEVEEALSGNLCRCTGYGGIWRAVSRAALRGAAKS